MVLNGKNMLEFNEDFLKNNDEDSDKEYIFEVDIEYPKNLHDLHSDLPFLLERMKINKCSKLVCNLHDKNNYGVHIRSLKQALYHGLILKKVHRVIRFKLEAWLKKYIDMNTELRKQTKNYFEKAFFKLMNNSVFGNAMENVRKHRDIQLVITDKRRIYLVLEPNYHTEKCFSNCLLAIKMQKIKVKMNKPVYLGLSILEISKILMYEFWYDYIKPSIKIIQNYATWIQTALSLVLRYKDIVNDVDEKIDTSEKQKSYWSYER